MKNLMTKVSGMFQGKKEALPLPTTVEEIRNHVANSLAAHLSIAPETISHSRAFSELGFDSLQSVRFSAELEDWLKVKLPPTLLWECPNVIELSDQLAIEIKLTETRGRAAVG